jgi:hypothetical protein
MSFMFLVKVMEDIMLLLFPLVFLRVIKIMMVPRLI